MIIWYGMIIAVGILAVCLIIGYFLGYGLSILWPYTALQRRRLQRQRMRDEEEKRALLEAQRLQYNLEARDRRIERLRLRDKPGNLRVDSDLIA